MAHANMDGKIIETGRASKIMSYRGLERVPVNDLKRQRQTAALFRVSQPVGQPLVQAVKPAAATQRGEARRMQVAPERAQLGQQALRRLESERDALHVHHRLGKPGRHQHVAPVVHVGELVPGRAPACLQIQRPQLAQGVGSQAGKHQETVHGQRPVPLRQQRLRHQRHRIKADGRACDEIAAAQGAKASASAGETKAPVAK